MFYIVAIALAVTFNFLQREVVRIESEQFKVDERTRKYLFSLLPFSFCYLVDSNLVRFRRFRLEYSSGGYWPGYFCLIRFHLARFPS